MNLNLPCSCYNHDQTSCTKHSPLGYALTMLNAQLEAVIERLNQHGIGLSSTPIDADEPVDLPAYGDPEYTRAGLCVFTWTHTKGAESYPHVYKDGKCIRCTKTQPEGA